MERRPALAIALAAFVLHLAFASRYGWFRDELYYVACARRLAWGYVDHPPAVAFVARVALAAFGESLVGLRAFAAAASAGTVVLVAELAAVLGGGRFARSLAALLAALAPYDLVVGQVYTMNAFEPLTWTGTALVVARALRDDAAKGSGSTGLYALGPIVGLGALNKHSVAWPVAALGLAILAAPSSRLLARREPWIAATVAAAIVAPHVVWQLAHGLPTREFAASALSGKNEPYGAVAFVWQQVQLAHPLAGPVWLGGLAALLAWKRLAPFRPLAIAYVLVATLVVATQAKAYYLGPALGWPLAAGAVAFEHLTRERARWTRAGFCALFVVGSLALLPMAVPVLGVAGFQRYFAALGGFGEAKSGEKQRRAALPQIYADMHGWPEMAARVADAVDALGADERATAAVLADNYGEASAVDFFARARGVTRVASGNNGWWLWGPPRPAPGEASEAGWPRVVVTIGYDADDLAPWFADAREVGRADHPLARADERDVPIFVCRSPRVPIDEAWPRMKHYK